MPVAIFPLLQVGEVATGWLFASKGLVPLRLCKFLIHVERGKATGHSTVQEGRVVDVSRCRALCDNLGGGGEERRRRDTQRFGDGRNDLTSGGCVMRYE